MLECTVIIINKQLDSSQMFQYCDHHCYQWPKFDDQQNTNKANLARCLYVFSYFLQWDIQSTKYRLFAQSKLTKLTTDSWESLEDLKNIYKGKFSVPDVRELAFIERNSYQ